MNHYPRHVGDIITATIGLSLEERGAYTALLDQYYVRESPLPLDRRECYRLAACNKPSERRAVDYVLAKYFTEQADGWHQKRCDEELVKYQHRAESARINGQNGGRPPNRNGTDSVPVGLPEPNPIETEQKTSQEPVTSNQENPERETAERTPSCAPARKTRGTRLAPDWDLPEAWARWAITERGWTLADAGRVAAEFRDHWLGKGEARADWEATWRNWVRRERGKGRHRQTERERVAAEIYGQTSHDRNDERTIDGEAKRVA